jgi:hypothetical protein
MRPDTYSARGEWAIAIAMIVGVLVALVLFLNIQEASAAPRASQSCGDVVVQFHPEGSGGAHAIQASGIGCEAARNVARSCVKGTVADGWTATTWDGKVQLTNDGKRIRYTGVGGGGCGFQQQGCHDFGYRGVGFFGLEAVGISCGGAKSKAKAWYDHGGNCSFGHTCEVSGYSCTAKPSTATITCTRENGFRFRWQMGE